jgi:hypothetical protein
MANIDLAILFFFVLISIFYICYTFSKFNFEHWLCRNFLQVCNFLNLTGSLSQIIDMAFSDCHIKYTEISQLVNNIHEAQAQRRWEMDYHHSRVEILQQDVKMAERGYNQVGKLMVFS